MLRCVVVCCVGGEGTIWLKTVYKFSSGDIIVNYIEMINSTNYYSTMISIIMYTYSFFKARDGKLFFFYHWVSFLLLFCRMPYVMYILL